MVLAKFRKTRRAFIVHCARAGEMRDANERQYYLTSNQFVQLIAVNRDRTAEKRARARQAKTRPPWFTNVINYTIL